MSRRTLFLILALALMGAGWGLTQPLSKIAVTGGYRFFGLIFWQLAIGAAFLTIVRAVRFGRHGPGRARSPQLRWPVPRIDGPAIRVYLVIALIGTVLPNSASYEAIRHLPSGLVSILLSLVPMFAFPIALALGNERLDLKRLGGLALGLFGVVMIMAPEASLPDRAMVAFIPLALIAPLFYGLEGNVVARWGTAGLSPIEVLHGASILGALIALPLAVASGQFIDPRGPWGARDAAVLGSAIIHVLVYTSYVWMVGAAGAIFAVQVSYLVTAFGVLWAMLILGESYSAWVWGATLIILTGVFLVQPRPREALAEDNAPTTIGPNPR